MAKPVKHVLSHFGTGRFHYSLFIGQVTDTSFTHPVSNANTPKRTDSSAYLEMQCFGKIQQGNVYMLMLS